MLSILSIDLLIHDNGYYVRWASHIKHSANKTINGNEYYNRNCLRVSLKKRCGCGSLSMNNATLSLTRRTTNAINSNKLKIESRICMCVCQPQKTNIEKYIIQYFPFSSSKPRIVKWCCCCLCWLTELHICCFYILMLLLGDLLQTDLLFSWSDVACMYPVCCVYCDAHPFTHSLTRSPTRSLFVVFNQNTHHQHFSDALIFKGS